MNTGDYLSCEEWGTHVQYSLEKYKKKVEQMCDSFSLSAITNVDKVLSINIPGRPHAYSVTKSIYHIAVNITYGLQFGSSQPANP